jgi:hypothetical protein
VERVRRGDDHAVDLGIVQEAAMVGVPARAAALLRLGSTKRTPGSWSAQLKKRVLIWPQPIMPRRISSTRNLQRRVLGARIPEEHDRI